MEKLTKEQKDKIINNFGELMEKRVTVLECSEIVEDLRIVLRGL